MKSKSFASRDGQEVAGYADAMDNRYRMDRAIRMISCMLDPRKLRYPKCASALASFGRHPNSCERTLKEVRHDIRVGIWVEFALIFRSGQRQH